MKSDAEAKLAAFSDSWTFDSRLENKKHRKFNDVFLVKRKSDGIQGICKYLKKSAQNEHLWSLLRKESEFTFTEKGLPQTLAFEENSEEIVLIRNYQVGIPLNEYWKKVPRKTQVDFVKKIIEKLIPIFEVLRKNGIVHCDIKPTNLIISEMNEDIEISLIDFGMAIQMQDLPERKTLFALGYSAPELILNKLHLLDHTSDIFALGVSIWQLFAGKLPLMHPNPGIMTNLQITHPLPENRAVPKQVLKVLEKMCYKHRFHKPPNHLNAEEVENHLKTAMQNRFQSLTEVLNELNSPRQENWFNSLFRNR